MTKVAKDFDPVVTRRPPVIHRQSRSTGCSPPANRNGWTEHPEGRRERDSQTHKDHSGQRHSVHRWDASYDEEDYTENLDRKLDDKRWRNTRCLHPDRDVWDNTNHRHHSGDGETHGLSNHDQRERSGPQQNGSFRVKLFFSFLVLVFTFLAFALMKHKWLVLHFLAAANRMNDWCQGAFTCILTNNSLLKYLILTFCTLCFLGGHLHGDGLQYKQQFISFYPF